jgi:hypothetical protein
MEMSSVVEEKNCVEKKKRSRAPAKSKTKEQVETKCVETKCVEAPLAHVETKCVETKCVEATKEHIETTKEEKTEEKPKPKRNNNRKKTEPKTILPEAPVPEAPKAELPKTELPKTEVKEQHTMPTPNKDNEPENEEDDEDEEDEEHTSKPQLVKKNQKKRGRKPKGGKIVVTSQLSQNDIVSEPNIILHLKCGKNDLENTTPDLLTMKYQPMIENIENYQFDKNKGSELNFFVISDTSVLPTSKTVTVAAAASTTQQQQSTTSIVPAITPNKLTPTDTDTFEGEISENKLIWKKLQKLSINLHNNNISDKKSACFWCTCDFDNPPIYIPKYELNDTYHCYGCFCSPECATASLFKESIDTSTKFERYHLINHIYCKIYNYTKNVKPAPEPYYTLNKYYGNLTIQEYRKMFKNDRLILIVDKPFTRSLPELHEDNDDFILNNKTIPTISNKYKTKQKPSKSALLSENFNMSSK